MPQEMIRVGLVGVTGYTGMELARLLTGHPNMKLTAATSRTEAGKRLGDLYPFLNGLPGADVILIEPEPELIAKECDLAFLAVPHTAATEMAAALVERGLKVVDLSADFRLKSAETYEQWYKVEHKRPDLLPEAVYGLPELYASDIAKARLVANPGCYPTSIILGMTAALADGLIETHGIVADSKSGVSGAGNREHQIRHPCRAVPPSSVRSTAKSRTPSRLTASARTATPRKSSRNCPVWRTGP